MQEDQISWSSRDSLTLPVFGDSLTGGLFQPIATQKALEVWVDATVSALKAVSGEAEYLVRGKVLQGLFLMPLVPENYCYNVTNLLGCALHRLQHFHAHVKDQPDAYRELWYAIYRFKRACKVAFYNVQ